MPVRRPASEKPAVYLKCAYYAALHSVHGPIYGSCNVARATDARDQAHALQGAGNTASIGRLRVKEGFLTAEDCLAGLVAMGLSLQLQRVPSAPQASALGTWFWSMACLPKQ